MPCFLHLLQFLMINSALFYRESLPHTFAVDKLLLILSYATISENYLSIFYRISAS